MKSQYLWDKFIQGKRRNAQSLDRYNEVFWSFNRKYLDVPSTPLEINEWLSEIKGSDSTLYTYYTVIRAMYKFGNEILDLPDPFLKLHAPKIAKTDRRIWTPEEIIQIMNYAKPGRDRILLMVLIDSTCRIGEIGYHELTPGKFFPGLNVSDLGKDYFVSIGKTGKRKYRCQPELIEAMQNMANQSGYIFTTSQGKVMTSHYLAKLVTKICKGAGITGTKIGAHTFRHTSGTLVAKHTRSALAVKALLQHDKIDTSMLYIHNAEDDIQQEISPLALTMEQCAKPNQLLMLEGPSSSDSTEITEVVEGIPDLTEELFPKIPADIVIHSRLKTSDLELIRRAFVTHARHSPEYGDAGNLSALLKRMIRLVK
jgi:integrase/recombinase XerD